MVNLKEKVENLYKGKFTYDIPGLVLSESDISFSVCAGSIYKGYFTISNDKNTDVKGILVSSCPALNLNTKEFLSAITRVEFTFDASYLEANETFNEYIKVISDCGEDIININAKIVRPYFNSKTGKIMDLTRFTYLARYHWSQAVDIFTSKDFPAYILAHDEKYAFIRQQLLKSKSMNHALEEFLLAVNQKLPIKLSISQNKQSYDIENESISDKILITMENWGYIDIDISTDSPFIQIEKNHITSESFLGNSYFLEFIVLPQKMHKGNNYGRIYITTTYETLVIDIKAKQLVDDNNQDKASRPIRLKENKVSQTKAYIDFRLKNISKEKYMSLINEILTSLGLKKDQTIDAMDSEISDYVKPLIIHLSILKNKANGQEIFDKIESKSDQWKKDNSNLYGLYMSLIYLNPKYEKDQKGMLKEFHNHFSYGVTSPYLYLETLNIFNDNPSLLTRLDQFEIQVINYGIKINYISKDLEDQFVYLASKEKKYNKLIFKALVESYKRSGSGEALYAICSLLIKGNKRGNQYFNWYNLGVVANLRIAELYEYFMYSIDESKKQELPQNLLYYFLYSSTLSLQKNSYLYAYIIRHKKALPNIYKSYLINIEKFAYEQLNLGQINNHLAVVYEDLFVKYNSLMDQSKLLWNVIFRYEIECDNPNIKGVLVAYREMENETYTPLNKGQVQIDIYNDDAEIFFVDKDDNLYYSEIQYSKERLMGLEEDELERLTKNKDNSIYLNYFAYNALIKEQYDEESLEARDLILEAADLSKELYERHLLSLINYYKNSTSPMLDKYLGMLDYIPKQLKDKHKLVALLIDRKFYIKAFNEIKKYGFEDIDVERLCELSTNLLKDGIETDKSADDTLLKMSYYCFSKGKYNRDILGSLISYYRGSCKELYNIWKVACDNDIDSRQLESNILTQIIFTNNREIYSYKIYKSFTRNGINSVLAKSFLNYQAYEYLVKDVEIDKRFLDSMGELVKTEKNDYCILSIMKYYSREETLDEDKLKFVYRFLDDYIERGIVLPFFKDFRNVIQLPYDFLDKTFVEMKTEPGSTVSITYRYIEIDKPEEDKSFTTEVMPHSIAGIFTKASLIFYNERLEYTIAVEKPDGTSFETEEKVIELGQTMEINEDNRYNKINFMLLAKDTKDDKTFIDIYNKIKKMDYVLSKIYKPL